MSDDKKEFTPQGEAEIRQQVIEEYGLDPNDEVNKPFIEKAVEKELDWQAEKLEISKKEKTYEQELADREKKLSKAIEQKKQWREKASKVLSEDDDDNNGKPNPTGEPTPKTENMNTNPVENEDLSALKKKVAELENTQQRTKYSHFSDEEYNAINSLAKAEGKSFEDTMTSNPLAKTYLETNKVNQRLANNTVAPSTRANPNSSISFDEISLKNPEHVKWLKSDPKRLEEYDKWREDNEIRFD